MPSGYGSGGIQVNGLSNLRRTLRQAGDDLGDLKDANARAAAIAASAAERRAPVITGALERSVRSSGTKTAGIIRAGNARAVPYANPIHWGWFSHHIKPNPFLSLGAQESQPLWVPIYEKALDEAVQKVSGL
jgi:hypothetical protein